MGDFSYENLLQYYYLLKLSDCVLDMRSAHKVCERVVGHEIDALRDLTEDEQRGLYAWFQHLYGELDG